MNSHDQLGETLPSRTNCPDALAALAVAGRGTGGIELGTAAVPTYPRHPAALAPQALTVALALEGRLALGIGLSHKIVIEDMFGYTFDRPARHMSEYLSLLLPLLDGETASFAGGTVRAHVGLSSAAGRAGRGPSVMIATASPAKAQEIGHDLGN